MQKVATKQKSCAKQDFFVENIVPKAFGRTDDLFHAMEASRHMSGPAELIPLTNQPLNILPAFFLFNFSLSADCFRSRFIFFRIDKFPIVRYRSKFRDPRQM